ncbi:hypothetical protein KHA90_11305 [Flavobacterium psychroterrae]|uniref:Uncharacterized protein n=1 Tax=Flavobacterium psychroterrae TaxID=2133767 RepID=A0ABS5PBE9_9FLAO|nr:hypothetical protein [Flavobacterium psychroterrae]MBS7231611.1 hypothetical protein [Flavobacterium psychroterrae]
MKNEESVLQNRQKLGLFSISTEFKKSSGGTKHVGMDFNPSYAMKIDKYLGYVGYVVYKRLKSLATK